MTLSISVSINLDSALGFIMKVINTIKASNCVVILNLGMASQFQNLNWSMFLVPFANGMTVFFGFRFFRRFRVDSICHL